MNSTETNFMCKVTIKLALKCTYQVKISSTYYGTLKGISKLPRNICMSLQSLYFRKNIAAEESHLDDFFLWVWAEKIDYSDMAFTGLTNRNQQNVGDKTDSEMKGTYWHQ